MTRAAVPGDTASADFHPAAALLSAHCGQSVDDAVKAARAALARDDAEGDHAALACLLAAVSAFNTDRLDAIRKEGSGTARMLAVPQYSRAAGSP